MESYPTPHYPNQNKNAQWNRTQAIAFTLNNGVHTDHILLGMLINVVLIVVLLLSRKS